MVVIGRPRLATIVTVCPAEHVVQVGAFFPVHDFDIWLGIAAEHGFRRGRALCIIPWPAPQAVVTPIARSLRVVFSSHSLTVVVAVWMTLRGEAAARSVKIPLAFYPVALRHHAVVAIFATKALVILF